MNHPKPFVRAAEGHGDAAKTRFKNSSPSKSELILGVLLSETATPRQMIVIDGLARRSYGSFQCND